MTTVKSIDLSMLDRTPVRVNNDENRVIMLNLSDFSMLTRLKEAYPRLQELSKSAIGEITTDEETSEIDKINQSATTLEKLDSEMRSIIDSIFDADVSSVCAPEGSMFDPINGQLRFEYILNALSELYSKNMQAEIKKTANNIAKYTNKYTGHIVN